MNQPKFFGLTVRDVKTGYIFLASHMKQDSGGEWYRHDEDERWVHGSHLELYQEPQKKKLYAYKDNVGEVKFSAKELDAFRVFSSSGNFGPLIGGALTTNCHVYDRAPEYDIEYPSSETK